MPIQYSFPHSFFISKLFLKEGFLKYLAYKKEKKINDVFLFLLAKMQKDKNRNFYFPGSDL